MAVKVAAARAVVAKAAARVVEAKAAARAAARVVEEGRDVEAEGADALDKMGLYDKMGL
ncbi:MAG TPA: hypothetical protein HPP58_00725 [Deltaproteobacteria bacterium]|nr:hypothetical protein [Deltaproteobacteria bacterium]